MARKVSLIINDNPIEIDHFVKGYVYHVAAGILASLKGTGKINDLQLNIDNDGQVEITLNGSDIPLSYFPVQIIRNTVTGMVANLKGVDGEVQTLELKISQ
jgi:hypothetical protein